MKAANKATKQRLLRELGEEDRVDMRSCGGTGGAFLLPPRAAAHHMADVHFLVALRRRLCVDDPACLDRVEGLASVVQSVVTNVAAGPEEVQQTCRHRRAEDGHLCGAPLDARGHHAGTCEIGGGVVHRHDGVRDWLAAWIAEQSGQVVSTEQYVPRWELVEEDGNIVRARLDVVFQDNQARTVYADVAIVAASTVCLPTRRARAARNGEAAAKAEDGMRLRYPGPNLMPFVVELLGRPGQDAISLLRSFAPTDPGERSEVLGKAWQTLSVLIQTAHAEQLLSARQ